MEQGDGACHLVIMRIVMMMLSLRLTTGSFFIFNCLQVLRPGLHKGSWTEQEDGVVKSMVNGVDVGKVYFFKKNSINSLRNVEE